VTDVTDDELDRRRAEVLDAIDVGEFERAEQLIDALADELGDGDPEVLYQRAVLAWDHDGPEQALAWLDQLLRIDPEHADGHYARGFACEELGDREGMIIHFLEVLRLDDLIAHEQQLGSAEDLDFIEATADEVLANVPAEFRVHLRDVPIVLEPRPHPEIVREGFDPRSLGLFEGLEQGRLEGGAAAVSPTRIVLFHANLLADFRDRAELAEQIEITLLHEIGHFFGLDEDDVERLGLQ
jgi:predicted Zn-dependent protease with MMP-like domain